MTDDADLLEMIREAAPGQALDRVEVNREGMVNDIVIANGEVVYRFPKSAWGERALANELRVLEIVRRHVSVPVPEPGRFHAIRVPVTRRFRARGADRRRRAFPRPGRNGSDPARRQGEGSRPGARSSGRTP